MQKTKFFISPMVWLTALSVVLCSCTAPAFLKQSSQPVDPAIENTVDLPQLKAGSYIRPDTGSSDQPVGPDDSSGSTPYKLNVDDPVMVSLRGIPPADQNFELKLDERGNINLPYINVVSAVGLTASDLAEKIQNTYIEKEIYKTITVNVVIPTQSYFVRGEVRSPGRFQLVAGVTVVQAIAASGGYTDFAAPAKVKILRGEKTLDVNLPKIEKGRNANIELRAGDVVVVPRSFF